MARATKKDKSSTTVTRISASDNNKPSEVKSNTKPKTKNKKNIGTKKAKIKQTKSKSTKLSQEARVEAIKKGEISRSKNPIKAFWHYLAGAWYELKQVHWPTRGATWSLTGAVLAFSAFFVIFILLADALFKYLFEIILK